jgi:hypothetical protein
MMRTKKLIKCFDFVEKNRERITLGPSVRLNPDSFRAQLQEDSDGNYSTATDLYVKTWVATPQSVKQWLLFEAVIVHWYDEDGDPITSDGFRLGDGTNEYWWDGGAWVINAVNWNTEAEVAANINQFPVSERSIQVIVNLETTDVGYTPHLYSVKVLYASDIEYQEDIVRSLIASLKDSIRPITDYPVKLLTDTDTIDLVNEFPLKTPYNIVDVDSAFNHDADPDHLVDILGSFNPSTQVITLNASLLSGTTVWLRLVYRPEVAMTTKRTYTEIGKVPVLVISDMNTIGKRQGQGDESVVDKATGSGTKVLAPLMLDIEFVLRCLTDKALDQHRLTDEVKRYFRQNPQLTSRGLDESYRLWLISEFDQQEPFGSAEIQTGNLRFQLANTLFYNRGDETVHAVKRFVVSGPPNLIVS